MESQMLKKAFEKNYSTGLKFWRGWLNDEPGAPLKSSVEARMCDIFSYWTHKGEEVLLMYNGLWFCDITPGREQTGDPYEFAE